MSRKQASLTWLQVSTGRPQVALLVAACLSILVAAIMCSTGRYTEAAAGAALLLAIGFSVAARISIETILITWFVTTPFVSFYFRFPIEKSIITFDRLVFASIFVMILWSGSYARFKATKLEISWALLSCIAILSVMLKSNNVGYAARIAIDSFWLPLAAFHVARWHFDAHGRGGQLLLAAIALALLLFATGAFEFAAGVNLFQYKGSELIREGELRVNGPFASDSSYAIICLLVALFLRSLPRVFRVKLDQSARLAYGLAVVAAVAASFLPLFRAVAVTLVFCWLFVTGARWYEKKIEVSSAKVLRASSARESSRAPDASRRSPLLAAIIVATLALAIWAVTAGLFSTGRRLESLHNLYGRLATWQAATQITLANPVAGVGLGNYSDHFDATFTWEERIEESVEDARPARSPHSNPLWIAAEMGLFALAFYAIANLYLFLMGYRALKRAGSIEQRAAAACYLAIAFAYWIPGLTLASGAYSDLNLYFFFMLGMLSKEFHSDL